MSVTMAKEPAKKGSRTPNKGSKTRDNQGGFRAFDPELIAALDAYAASKDRSRNYVMNEILEAALRQLGFYPVPKVE